MARFPLPSKAVSSMCAGPQDRKTAGRWYGTVRKNSSFRVEEVFEPALEGILDALSTDRAAILLFDPDGVVRFKAWRGLSHDYRRAVEGHSPWKRGEKGARAIVVEDAE